LLDRVTHTSDGRWLATHRRGRNGRMQYEQPAIRAKQQLFACQTIDAALECSMSVGEEPRADRVTND
jgi:hypothetical protein